MENLKSNQLAIQNKIQTSLKSNYINNMPMDDFIFNRIMNRVNPQYYCENVLRAHLPENRRHLHENQLA